MKNLDKKQYIVILVIAVILSFITLLDYGICNLENEPKMLKLTVKGDKNTEAKGAEVRIININIDGQNLNLEEYTSINDIVYQDGQLIIYPYNHEINIEIPTSNLSFVSIDFLKHEWSGKVSINNNNKNIVADLYSTNGGSYNYIYHPNYINLLNKYFFKETNIILSFLIYILILSITYLMLIIELYIYNKIKSTKLRWYYIPLISFLTYLLISPYLYFMLIISKLILLVSILCLLILILYDLRKTIRLELEKNFLIITLISGILMIIILPPGHVPDEFSHFINSYQKAQLVGNKNVIEGEYIHLPVSFYESIDRYVYDIHNFNYKTNARLYLKDFKIPLHKNELSEYNYWFGNTVNLNILTYLPSIFIIAILQFINIPFIGLFLASRFINFIIWLIICYYALKITPKYKRIFTVIMLMPITIQQAIGINQDWLTNALSFLLVALILNEIYKDEKELIKNKDIVIIVSVEVLLGFCKQGYFPLAFLSILISNKRFKNNNQLIWNKFIMAFTCLIITFIQMSKSQGILIGGHPTGLKYDLTYILNNPIEIIKIYLNTFIERGKLDLFNGIIDGFGWSIKWHNSNISFIMMIIYILMILGNNENNIKNNLYEKSVMIFSAICIIGLIYTALFIGWTSRGSQIVEGLQSRYFIPANLLIYMSLNNEIFSINSKKFKDYIYICLLSLGIFLSFCTLIVGYYIT